MRSFTTLILTIILIASAGCLGDDEKKNQPPVADAGPDQTVTMVNDEAVVTFSASASSDPDGDDLTYRWDFDSNNGDNDIDDTKKGTTHAYYMVGTFTVTLKVSDGKLTSEDTIKVTVKKEPGNVEAVINTDDELKSTVGADEVKTITFDGSGSNTREGTIEEWEWDFNYTGPHEFDVDASGDEVSNDFESGTHVIALRVTNDTGAENIDYVEVKINYNMSYENEELEDDEDRNYYFPLNSDNAFYLRVALVSNNTDNDGHNLDIYLYFPNGTEANNTADEDEGHEEIRYNKNTEYGENLKALGEWRVRIYNNDYNPVSSMEYDLYIDVVYFS